MKGFRGRPHKHTDDSGTFECPMGSACDKQELRQKYEQAEEMLKTLGFSIHEMVVFDEARALERQWNDHVGGPFNSVDDYTERLCDFNSEEPEVAVEGVNDIVREAAELVRKL